MEARLDECKERTQHIWVRPDGGIPKSNKVKVLSEPYIYREGEFDQVLQGLEIFRHEIYLGVLVEEFILPNEPLSESSQFHNKR